LNAFVAGENESLEPIEKPLRSSVCVFWRLQIVARAAHLNNRSPMAGGTHRQQQAAIWHGRFAGRGFVLCSRMRRGGGGSVARATAEEKEAARQKERKKRNPFALDRSEKRLFFSTLAALWLYSWSRFIRTIISAIFNTQRSSSCSI